jgi:hypothetical protein
MSNEEFTLPGLPNDAMTNEIANSRRFKTQAINTDSVGRSAMVSMSGDSHVGFKVDDISVNFQYGISTNDIRDGGSSSGTGSVAHVGSTARVSTGAGVGVALIESRASIRYRAGHEVHGAISVELATPQTNVDQFAGFLNTDDGWSVGYQDLVFGLWFIEGGNINFIPQDSFNIDKLDGSGLSKYNINPQKSQVYRLTYTWHGALPLILEVYQPGIRAWIPAHAVEFVNSESLPHLENPNLPMACKIERRSGTGADMTIITGSWRGGVVAGGEEDNNSSRIFAAFVLSRAKTSSPDHLITLRSKDVFTGKVNHIRAEVTIIISINSTNKELVFKAVNLSNLDAADQAAIELGFVDVNTANSMMEKSDVVRALTTSITDSITNDVAVVLRNDFRENTDVKGFSIYPGEDVVFLVESTGTAAAGEVSLQLNFKELF